jgi:hypothetical protein
MLWNKKQETVEVIKVLNPEKIDENNYRIQQLEQGLSTLAIQVAQLSSYLAETRLRDIDEKDKSKKPIKAPSAPSEPQSQSAPSEPAVPTVPLGNINVELEQPLADVRVEVSAPKEALIAREPRESVPASEKAAKRKYNRKTQKERRQIFWNIYTALRQRNMYTTELRKKLGLSRAERTDYYIRKLCEKGIITWEAVKGKDGYRKMYMPADSKYIKKDIFFRLLESKD